MKMKTIRIIGLSCGLLACAALSVPSARADDAAMKDQLAAQSAQIGPSQEDIQRAIASYYQYNGPVAGGRDAQLLPDGVKIGLDGLPIQEEEEVNKKYRYDGGDKSKNGTEMPRRTFNNISYPY